MSNSYIIELERLRQELEEILDNKGISVTSGEPLSSLIPKVNAIGIAELAAMANGSAVAEINDVEGLITTINTTLFQGLALGAVKIRFPACTNVIIKGFQDCTGLNEVEIGQSGQAITVNQTAFNNCSSMTKIAIKGNATLNSSDSNNTTGMFKGCSALKEVYVENWVGNTERGTNTYMFSGCTALEKVKIDRGTALATYAMFAGCSALKLIDVGEMASITGTSNLFLNNCGNLKAFVIRKADGVTSLANSAIFNYPISNNPDFMIFVPLQKYEDYDTGQWSNVYSNIDGIQNNLDSLIPLGFDYSDYVVIVDELPVTDIQAYKTYWIKQSETESTITYSQSYAEDASGNWSTLIDITIDKE